MDVRKEITPSVADSGSSLSATLKALVSPRPNPSADRRRRQLKMVGGSGLNLQQRELRNPIATEAQGRQMLGPVRQDCADLATIEKNSLRQNMAFVRDKNAGRKSLHPSGNSAVNLDHLGLALINIFSNLGLPSWANQPP